MEPDVNRSSTFGEQRLKRERERERERDDICEVME